MEQLIIQNVLGYGAFGIFAYLFWKKIETTDNRNREDTNVQIADLKLEVKENKQENKKDKEMFERSVACFEKSVSEFCATNNKIDRLEKDVDFIKCKLDK